MGKLAIQPEALQWHPGPVDQAWPVEVFDVQCRQCDRLAQFHDTNRKNWPEHFNGPVPPFGADQAELLIVGLAPGLHGANRTGRPFTGDYCGDLLYRTLHQFGFANQACSTAVGDGFGLINARVSNAVKCVPPKNKPTPLEVRTCSTFLRRELDQFPPKVMLALGGVAHQAVLKALGHKQSAYKFGHGAQHDLGRFTLMNSYHVSRYNTQTRRLTPAMFEAVIQQVVDVLSVSE